MQDLQSVNSFQWFLPLVSLLLSSIITRQLIVYAHKRQLLDQPGKRRSHNIPTPRGGGLAIVLAVLSCSFFPFYKIEKDIFFPIIAIFFGTILIAAVGWWDDHRSLSAKFRFIVHLLVAFLFASTLNGIEITLSALIVLSCAWSINLHNFMDGTDGLLSIQALFVFFSMAVLGWYAEQYPLVISMITLCSAVMGFLWFNFPPARIFMGDVGSGTLGFLIAAFLLWAYAQGWMSLSEGLILISAFVVDATCTLLMRMLKGRKWYRPHREHLYQWMARTGKTHRTLVIYYFLWNLLIVAPFLGLAHYFPAGGNFIAAVLYGISTGIWFYGKKLCLKRPEILKRTAHVIA